MMSLGHSKTHQTWTVGQGSKNRLMGLVLKGPCPALSNQARRSRRPRSTVLVALLREGLSQGLSREALARGKDQEVGKDILLGLKMDQEVGKDIQIRLGRIEQDVWRAVSAKAVVFPFTSPARPSHTIYLSYCFATPSDTSAAARTSVVVRRVSVSRASSRSRLCRRSTAANLPRAHGP